MTKNRFLIGAILLMAVLSFMGCDVIFTTPWAVPREYDVDKIEVKKDDLASWKKAAAGNPDLALALAKSLKGTDDPDLLAAGASFAIQAAGMGTSILGKVGTLLDIVSGDGDVDALTKLFKGIQDDFKKGNGAEAADVLAEILVGMVNTDGTFKDGYTPSSGDAIQAVIVLTLALVGDTTIDNFSEDTLKQWVDFSGDEYKIKPNAGDKAKVLVAFLNFIASDDNSMSDVINGALGGK